MAIKTKKTVAKPASVVTPDAGPHNSNDIAALAYHLWQSRGCPEGSPEEDWFRAEQVLENGNGGGRPRKRLALKS